MQLMIDDTATNQATALDVDTQLIDQAISLDIDLSLVVEKALLAEIEVRKAKQWLADNKEGIDNCNQYAQKYGLFADKHRVF